MSVTIVLLSLATGTIIGFLYGLFFVLQRKRVLSSLPNRVGKKEARQYVAHTTYYTIIRLIILGGIGWLLLSLPSINPIIVLPSILVTFWLVIINYKAFFYGRH